MATPEDYKTVCGKSAVVLWLNGKGEYTAARLRPKVSVRLLEKVLEDPGAPSLMTSEPTPQAALDALIEWQAKEIREGSAGQE